MSGTTASSALLLLILPALTTATPLTQTPPLGWSSWNAYHSKISEDILVANARALKAKGLLAAGYSQFNIDGG